MIETQTQILLDLYNPWLRQPTSFIPTISARLSTPWIERRGGLSLEADLRVRNRAHLIVGPRQAGKSSLVWSLLRAQHAEDHRLLFLSAEEPILRAWCGSPGLFVADCQPILARGGTLFIDEAQHLDDAGLFVKGLVDLRPDWSIVVAGSASFHLLSKTRESLAGRASRCNVWPLDLAEASGVDHASGLNALTRTQSLARLLITGGYPGVWTAKDPIGQLTELLSAFVLRNASDLFRIERPAGFRRLLELAAGEVGDLVSTSKWAQITGVSSYTVERYLDLMAETHVLARVRPFIGGKRAELTKTPKVFFIDNGLRNAVRSGFERLDNRGDIGKLLENWVFSELHKRWREPGEVRYWRTKGGAEIDFVIESRSGALYGLEVKASAGHPKVSRAARSFISAYRPAVFFLIHQGQPGATTIGETEVRWTPAISLPETLDALRE